MYILDNECSSDLKFEFGKEHINFQLFHPASHRANDAERIIQMHKNHLKAGLVTVDPEFPIIEWDQLLEQSIITLNLLRAARANSKARNFCHI